VKYPPKLPNFVFIGPDKSGSTWINKILNNHSSVYVSPAKDTYYFDRNYFRGKSWYLNQFPNSSKFPVVAEVCHDYLFSPIAAERIASDLPDVRLMVTLREPIDRAYSAYLYMRALGMTRLSFEDAVLEYPNLLRNGLYALHLESYFSLFEKSRIYVSVFDDLNSDPQLFADHLFGYLGVDSISLSPSLQSAERAASQARFEILTRCVKQSANLARQMGAPKLIGKVKSRPFVSKVLYRPLASAARPAISERTRSELRDFFCDDIHHLDSLTSGGFARRWGYSRPAVVCET